MTESQDRDVHANIPDGPDVVAAAGPVGSAPPAPSTSSMTLFSRLLISHATPLVIVTLALVLALSALVRISVLLTTLSDAELDSLQDEGMLHKQAWALDVEMRHAQLACAQGAAASEIGPRIAQRTAALARVRDGAVMKVPDSLLGVVAGYLAVGSEGAQGDVCGKLLEGPLTARRAQLDEQLTNLWVARLEELHHAVRDKEGKARSLAVVSTWVGIPLALVSCVLALVVARRMAASVKEPLAQLAGMAERVGRGDFQSRVSVQGPIEIVGLAEELERMRLQLAQLEALKQGFLASVSHELRTPLSKIREALALLQDGAVGPLSERQLRVVQIARTACEREIRMVTTLLDLSRLRAGSPVRLRDHGSLDGVLHSAVVDERSDAAARSVTVELVAEGEVPACRFDPVLLERALANLIRNAVSVSQAGQRVLVERRVEHERAGRQGSAICIQVSDEGPGVPKEIRDRLFDPFVTSAIPGVGKSLGVGIGLALAREVARAHGGDLVLVPTARPGACFELWFPVTSEASAEAAGSTPRTLGIERVKLSAP